MSGAAASGGVPSPAVRFLRIAAPLGALAMFATIVIALGTGASLGEQGAEVGALVWGRVTFVDLGLMLVTGWLWIAWREGRVVSALVWLVATAVTGAGAVLLYLSVAAWRNVDMRGVLVGDAG